MDTADATRLHQLEVDIAAVASALETVDRIVAETADGESAAVEIAAVVSAERFPLDSDEQQAASGPQEQQAASGLQDQRKVEDEPGPAEGDER